MSDKNVICILAKQPVPGSIKIKLQDNLGKKQAAFLARAFLMDTIATSLSVPRSRTIIAHWPSDSVKAFEDIIYLYASEEPRKKISGKADSISLIPQTGDDTGQRFSYLSEKIFGMGAERVLFVSSDCPQLEPAIYRAAFELLKKKQAVIGPTFDGGFYMMGLRQHCPDLFMEIEWGSSSVYKSTVDRIDDHNLAWQELEISYDIDSPEELEQLYLDIDNLRLSGDDFICFHTEKCLANLSKN